MRTQAEVPTFSPPTEKIPEILDHLDDAGSSLANVAHANNTTVEALSAWLMLPEIQERNARIDHAAAHRTRSLAARALRCGVAALHFALARAIEEEKDETISNHPKLSLAATRRRDLINRSTRTLMQVAPSLALAAPKRTPTPAKPDTSNTAPHTHRLTTIITELDALTDDLRTGENTDDAPQQRSAHKANRQKGHSSRNGHSGRNGASGQNGHRAENGVSGHEDDKEHSGLNGREKPTHPCTHESPFETSNVKLPDSATPPFSHHQAPIEAPIPVPQAAVPDLEPTPAAPAASSPASLAPPPRTPTIPR